MSSMQEQGGQASQQRPRTRDGFSLIEVVVSLVLLSAGIVGVTSGGAAVTRQLRSARGDLGLWAAMQTVGDSLQQRGYGRVAGGTAAIGNINLSWVVDSSAANLHRVTVAGSSAVHVGVADTVVLFLVKP